MKDGSYTIEHRNGELPTGTAIGSFEIVEGKIKNRTGLAKEVLKDGLVDGRTEFDIKRLNNGYNWVIWSRPVKHEPEHSLEPEEYLGTHSKSKPRRGTTSSY